MRKYKLGLIGCGHMGHAMIEGAIAKEYLKPNEICVYDHHIEKKEQLEKEGFTVLDNELEVANNSHVTILAVKPQQIDTLLHNLKDANLEVVLSVVTGVSIKSLQASLNNVPVIRSMPNTPLQIGEGATALCKSDNCSEEDYKFVFDLFNIMGVTRTVPEEEINESVAVHGSTPAYYYYFAECIIDDAVKNGWDEETARALVVQTMIGAGKLLRDNPDKPISEFVDEVCSKGGTTIEAITKFKELDLESMVHEANFVCIKRAKELGK